MPSGDGKVYENRQGKKNGEMSQTSLWWRLTNSSPAFLCCALFLSCDYSNRWNATGKDRNISIYSWSRANRLKQLFPLQLNVCTNVTGHLEGACRTLRLRLVEFTQASWELCTTKRRTCLCLMPGDWSGRVWTASVTGSGHRNAWCSKGRLGPADLAG